MGILNRKKHKYDKMIDEVITNAFEKEEHDIEQTAQLCKEIGLNEKQTTILLKAVVSGSMKDISKASIGDEHIDAINQIMIKQLNEFDTLLQSQDILITPEEHFSDVLKYDMLRYISYLYVANAYDKGFGEFILKVLNDAFVSNDFCYTIKDIDKCLVTNDLTDVFQGRYFSAKGPEKMERFVKVVPYGIYQMHTLLLILPDTTVTESMLQIYLSFQMVLTLIAETYSIKNIFYMCVNDYNYYMSEWLPDNKSTAIFFNYCKRINTIMHKYEKR